MERTTITRCSFLVTRRMVRRKVSRRLRRDGPGLGRHAALNVQSVENVRTVKVLVLGDERRVHRKAYVAVGDNTDQLVVL